MNTKWIKVLDRLPECDHPMHHNGSGVDRYSDNVLVWCNDRLMVLCLDYIKDDDGHYGYCWANCMGDINCTDPEYDDHYEPTHWMPLPTKPEDLS